MESKKLILVLTIFMTTATLGFKIPNLTSYYQDLTHPIDKILFENDKTNFTTQVLKTALNRSINVLYSTDIRLNNINDLIPVINLLNNTKPMRSRLSIFLSLKYTYKNRFSRPDYDDVFYNLQLNFTRETWAAIFSSIDYIAVDMTTEDCTDANFFYSKPGIWSMDQPLRNFSFPHNIKSFLGYYQQLTNYNKHIKVGLAYNSSQVGCAEYLRFQIKDADFVMITQEFLLHRSLPFSYEALRGMSEKLQEKNYDTYIGNNYYYSQFCQINKFFYNLQINKMPTTVDISSTWSYNMQNLLSSSSFYGPLSERLIERIHFANLELLLARRSDKEIYSGYSKCSFVLGDSIIAELSNSRRDDSFESGIIIPTVVASEYKFNPDTTRSGLNKIRNGSFLVDEYTWRSMARLESSFKSFSELCKPQSVHNPTNISGCQVLLVFQQGISKEWSEMEKNMDFLVDKHRNIANFSLSTIIFHESDIFPVKYTGYDGKYAEIPNFLKKLDNTYSTGCMVNFTVDRIRNNNEGSGGFSEKMRKLCEPVFEFVDLFIWNLPKGYQVTEPYDAMVLAREIFLAEFPEKQVLLRLDYDLGFDVVTDWFKFYGASAIYK